MLNFGKNNVPVKHWKKLYVCKVTHLRLQHFMESMHKAES
jgi:hypothetical protein